MIPNIQHTTVKPYYNKNGELRTYSIYPDEGYRLHVKSLDEEIVDEETLESTGEVKKDTGIMVNTPLSAIITTLMKIRRSYIRRWQNEKVFSA